MTLFRDVVEQENSLRVFINYSSYLMLTKWCLNIEAGENYCHSCFGCFNSLSRGDVQVLDSQGSNQKSMVSLPNIYYLQYISTNFFKNIFLYITKGTFLKKSSLDSPLGSKIYGQLTPLARTSCQVIQGHSPFTPHGLYPPI